MLVVPVTLLAQKDMGTVAPPLCSAVTLLPVPGVLTAAGQAVAVAPSAAPSETERGRGSSTVSPSIALTAAEAPLAVDPTKVTGACSPLISDAHSDSDSNSKLKAVPSVPKGARVKAASEASSAGMEAARPANARPKAKPSLAPRLVKVTYSLQCSLFLCSSYACVFPRACPSARVCVIEAGAARIPLYTCRPLGGSAAGQHMYWYDTHTTPPLTPSHYFSLIFLISSSHADSTALGGAGGGAKASNTPL